MTQGFQRVAGTDAAPANVGLAETGQVTLSCASDLAEGDSAELETAVPQTLGASAGALASAVPEEAGHRNAAVILDEANDLLVINEPGALLPSAQSGWTEAPVTQSGLLSEASASWAQEILGAEADSAGAKSLEAPRLPEDGIERNSGEVAALLTVDWIDW